MVAFSAASIFLIRADFVDGILRVCDANEIRWYETLRSLLVAIKRFADMF